MTRRSRRGWVVFAVAAVAFIVALAWLTLELEAGERRRAELQADMETQRDVRLALWRLDGAIGPVLAQENARATYPAWNAQDELGPTPRFFGPYFWLSGEEPPLESTPTGQTPRPERVATVVSLNDLWQLVPATAPDPFDPSNAILYQSNSARQSADVNYMTNDLAARGVNRDRAQHLALQNPRREPPMGSRALTAPFSPVWVKGEGGAEELILLRRETPNMLQGILVDQPALEAWLLAEVADLFPGGSLRPLTDDDGPAGGRLAGLPLVFEPGAPRSVAAAPVFRFAIVIAWCAGLGALLAVGLSLRASNALSDRRGRFVSAVTHELRTPLTTFRMYAEMLSDGMVSDDAARAEYLRTLRTESDRLHRVVESVLLYSRLEEGAVTVRRRRVDVEELLDTILPAVARPVADAEMELIVDFDVPSSAEVEVDSQAMEQILVNLADNAAKYAADATDRRVHLVARVDDRLRVTVCDHGSGVPADEREAIFRPFRRGRAHEAGSAAGVGIGLALARDLARASGGGLTCHSPEDGGAAFVLTLPLASASD